jgi:hypothetical protein
MTYSEVVQLVLLICGMFALFSFGCAGTAFIARQRTRRTAMTIAAIIFGFCQVYYIWSHGILALGFEHCSG